MQWVSFRRESQCILPAAGSALMSQQYIGNEPPLNSNAEKTRLRVDRLTEVWLEAPGGKPVFPQG